MLVHSGGMVRPVYLFATKSPFSAMAWPVLVLGGIELVIGVTVATRTAAQVAELEAGLQSRRTVTITSEIERMARVNGTFVQEENRCCSSSSTLGASAGSTGPVSVMWKRNSSIT